MKTTRRFIAILLVVLIVGLRPDTGLAQTTGEAAGPSPALVAAANAYQTVSAQLDAWLAENKELVATAKQVSGHLSQLEAGTPREWVRARGAAARKVYDQQIRRLQAEMREALVRLGTLPRGSAEATALQARVKAIDGEITAAARAMGVIKSEEERLRVFASRLTALIAREEAAVNQVNSAITASNEAIQIVRAAIAAKDDAGATSAYQQATSRLQVAVRDGPKAHQISRQIIDLLRAEIAARGGPPPQPPPEEYGEPPDENPALAAEPPGPSPTAVAAAEQTLQLNRQLQAEQQQIEARAQEQERLRLEVDRQSKGELIAEIKNYREGVRDIYTRNIRPQQERLTAVEAELNKVDPDSAAAKTLRAEAEMLKNGIRAYTQSLGTQKALLDGLTRDVDAGRSPIRKLQEAQRRAEAELRAELARLRDAEKAIADNWKAAEAARDRGDRKARDAAIDRILQAYVAATTATDRYKLKQAELVSILVSQKEALRAIQGQ